MAHELAAAVDLDGLQGHGEGFDDVVEEAPRALARSVPKAVAREKTRATMKRLSGQTARNSLMVRPSREKVMWSIWTSWPGFRGLAPYFQRCAQPLNLRRRLGSRRPSQALARGTRPLAMARERMRPTVETLRRRPLRSSMRWMGALPMNGCLRRRSMTAFTSLVLYDRRRTWRGRVDFGARPRWPLAASAAFHRNMVRRLTPISFKAACSAQPAARSASKRRMASRRSRAGAGSSAPSTLKLRYDRVRMDSMFMVRVLLQWVWFTEGYPNRRRRRSFRHRRRTQPVMAAAVPNLSEPAQMSSGGMRTSVSACCSSPALCSTALQ